MRSRHHGRGLATQQVHVSLQLQRRRRWRNQQQAALQRHQLPQCRLHPCHSRCTQPPISPQLQQSSARSRTARQCRSSLSAPQLNTLQSHRVVLRLSKRSQQRAAPQRKRTPQRQLALRRSQCSQPHSRLQHQQVPAHLQRARRRRSIPSATQSQTLQSHHSAIRLSGRPPCR